jgi:hypothetical protein
LRVGKEVDFDDLAVPHRDGGDRERAPVKEGDDPRGAVDERAPVRTTRRRVPSWCGRSARSL